jgi:GTP-binding protein
MFVDEAEIIVRSGKGGDGMMHFHREKFVNRGGPDGGDGGKGGDIIIKVVPLLNTLLAFRHQSKFIADDGKKGGVNNQTGRSADPLIIDCPPGTTIFDVKTGDMIGDLTEVDQTLLVCPGGRGGRGNPHFASARRQAPRIAEKGEPGTEKTLRLELKLIADVGIIGMPNAGKSSLLAAVSNAKPKIADYPFTTLVPNLGVAQLDEDTTLILADIPGLIEGAHSGHGLGDAFLRHLQRTRVLIHLLDGLSTEPFADYGQINSELALFDPMLAQKPQVVALNKIDLPEVRKHWTKIRKDFERHKIPILDISAITHENLTQLLWQAYTELKNAPAPEITHALPVYRPEPAIPFYNIQRTPSGWQVSGQAIERAAAMTFWEYDDSIRRFQRIMESLGVDAALREAGIKEGDTVVIGKHELTWQD